MKILAIEKEINSIKPEDYDLILKEEAQKVFELYESGIIREIYFEKENNIAVIILECSNKIEAKEILNSLPLVKKGFVEFEVIELISYTGFSRLMKSDRKFLI